MTTASTAGLTRGSRIEGWVLVVILLLVGVAAGAASFTHVHDWTMNNSPASTGDWFGWANAVITELVPIAALLVMRRRRATGQPVLYPVILLGGALALSVTAQLAVAKPGLSGGLVSVILALAFAALAKLILGKTPTTATPADQASPTSVPVPAPPAAPDTVRVPAVPDATPVAAQPVPVVPDAVPVPADPAVVPSGPVFTNVRALAVDSSPSSSSWPSPALPAELLDRARTTVAEHQQRTGEQITRDELRAVLRVSNGTTGDVMRALGLSSRTVPAINGHQADAVMA